MSPAWSGPNGSGKSNVVDGLAWVMGEQGAKTLRGGKMEDVIFAGTATRGPLGRAEVQLTIDNSDGALPIEYAEVTISRTLFRNGGSEYAINGEQCRLLDVQELLSDSGLGREMHVIVGQGQLDQVLHATPEDRRGFIEEAAGILKHRRRKEKTLRKLDAMQANLTRLSDLAGEIRRQLKPLGHQAQIAREAQTIAAIVRDARARLLADEVVELRAAITGVTRSESERKTERVVLQEQLDQSKLRQARIEQSMTGDAVDEARRVAFGLEQVQDHLRSLYTLANQRLSLLSQQAELPGHELHAVRVGGRRRLRRGGRAAGRHRRRRGGPRPRERRHGDGAGESRLARRGDQRAVAPSSASTTSSRAASPGRCAPPRSAEPRRRRSSTVRRPRSRHAEERREAARAELVALEGDDAGIAEDTELAGAVEAADAAVQAAAGAGRRPPRRAAHRRARARRPRRPHERPHPRHRPEGRRRSRSSASPASAVWSPSTSRSSPGYEAAIAAALGTLADAVLADSWDAGVAALDHARSASAGRVEIVIADAVVSRRRGVAAARRAPRHRPS